MTMDSSPTTELAGNREKFKLDDVMPIEFRDLRDGDTARIRQPGARDGDPQRPGSREASLPLHFPRCFKHRSIEDAEALRER